MAVPTLDEYAGWARDNIAFDPENEQFRRRFAQNTGIIRTSIEQSEQWAKVLSVLNTLSERYHEKYKVSLFTESGWKPSLHIKPIESVVEKTWRQNVLHNKQFPQPPKGDPANWITESNMYGALNDLIRCRVVCRYMDGPQFICDAAKHLLGDGIVAKTHSMETELGYYAWHLGVIVPATVMRANGDVDDQPVQFEVQLTTHLNDVLNDLTHSFYEDRRTEKTTRDPLWKWDPSNPQFKGAFFGHTLHLLEGMIVELKNEMTKEPQGDDE